MLRFLTPTSKMDCQKSGLYFSPLHPEQGDFLVGEGDTTYFTAQEGGAIEFTIGEGCTIDTDRYS